MHFTLNKVGIISSCKTLKRLVWIQLVDRLGNNYRDTVERKLDLPPWTSIRELKITAKKAFGNLLRDTQIEDICTFKNNIHTTPLNDDVCLGDEVCFGEELGKNYDDCLLLLVPGPVPKRNAVINERRIEVSLTYTIGCWRKVLMCDIDLFLQN
jgi:hypothetical protein